MTIALNPEYEALRPFLLTIPRVFNSVGKTIYQGRNTIKVITTPDGLRLNVKRYHVPKGPNRLVYSWGIRKPKGLRAFQYPAILLAKDIPTPEPVAYIEERGTLGLLGYTYFISLQIDYGHTFYEFGNAAEGTYEEAAEALGRFAASMHEKGVFHKDFTPGNILWKKDSEGYHFMLVDINRMNFGPVSMKRGLSNLIKFWGPRRFTELLITAYCKARHANVQQGLAYPMPKREQFWIRFSRKHTVKFPFTPEPMNILVIRFRQMGDAVLTTAMLNTLRQTYPDAQINFVLNSNLCPLFTGHPAINNLIAFTDKEQYNLIAFLRKVWQIVHSCHYHVIIDMRTTPKTLPFCVFALSSHFRIGLRKWYSRAVFNHTIPPCRQNESMIDHNLAMLHPLEAMGKVRYTRQFTLSIAPEEVVSYGEYLKKQGINLSKPIILCGPTAKLDHKTWGEDNMIWVIRKLIDTYPEAQFIFNYAPGREREKALRIWHKLNKDTHIFIHTEAVNMRELVALAHYTTFFFGNEGGARHIIQAGEKPSFVVCAPQTSIKKWIPENETPAEGISNTETKEVVWERMQQFIARHHIILK